MYSDDHFCIGVEHWFSCLIYVSLGSSHVIHPDNMLEGGNS